MARISLFVCLVGVAATSGSTLAEDKSNDALVGDIVAVWKARLERAKSIECNMKANTVYKAGGIDLFSPNSVPTPDKDERFADEAMAVAVDFEGNRVNKVN